MMYLVADWKFGVGGLNKGGSQIQLLARLTRYAPAAPGEAQL